MKSLNINILKWEIFKDLPIKTGITTRTGGFSAPPFSSFNLATHTGDSISNVLKNRELLLKNIGCNSYKYCCGTQVHGDHIETIKEEDFNIEKLVCDGLLTDIYGPVLNIFVADCVPIVVYDKELKIGGLCHCGWKGTFSNLLPKMINKMINSYESKPKDILIGIGPSIGSCCYNISKELYVKFNPKGNEGYIKDKKYFIDLKEINKNQGLKCGIPKQNIEVMDYCTSCSNDMFFSYRKEGEPSGRFSCYLKITS